MTVTFADAARFLADQASLKDLELLTGALEQRRATLAKERMQSITAGQDVRLDQIKPAELAGLTGTVQHVYRAPRTGGTANVLLDAESTYRLALYPKYCLPRDATEFTVTVPLGTVFPR
ncbi:hypothetical protein [Streptomyces luteireticuli]|uniref:hypothetical protein n=1 Tax=Streptomyces luteireticuli TaxID=173858 RepID=UPI00355855BA